METCAVRATLFTLAAGSTLAGPDATHPSFEPGASPLQLTLVSPKHARACSNQKLGREARETVYQRSLALSP
ncbi:MAG TPA: hypothetical protein VGF67_03370 [Ktedonobacteraceae bacterium]